MVQLLTFRSSENGVDTTGCIISNLNKNTNTGLVFNMNDLYSSLSLKFESRGNDMNDFQPFNAKEYIFNVFDLNPSNFQDLAVSSFSFSLLFVSSYLCSHSF